MPWFPFHRPSVVAASKSVTVLQPHEWKIPFWCHFPINLLDARVLCSPLPSSFRHQIPVQCDTPTSVMRQYLCPQLLHEFSWKKLVQLQESRLFCLFIYSQIYICSHVQLSYSSSFQLISTTNVTKRERASCIVYVILAILLSLGKLQKNSHLL